MVRFWSCLGLRIMSLDSKLQAWAKGAGKERVQAAAMKKVTESDIRAMASDLAETITAAIPPALYGSLVCGIVVRKSGDAEYSFDLNFDEGPLRRPSLNPSNSGVYNILGLFSQGYTITKRVPRGLWYGQTIYALKHRDGQKFIEPAVASWAAGHTGNGITVKDYTVSPLYT